MAEVIPKDGDSVPGTITSVMENGRGNYDLGRKVGDTFNLGVSNSDSLCP